MGPSVLVLPSPLWPPEAVARTLSEARLASTARAGDASAVVFSPERAPEARACVGAPPYRERAIPLVAFVPTAASFVLVAPDALEHVGVVADAYASDATSLADAVAWVTSAAPAAGSAGPLRVTYLGSLGESRPPRAPAIGASTPLGPPGERLLVGRSEDCALCLRQGPHSDQNTVARRHTAFERGARGAIVTDMGSTNGTYVRGVRIKRTAEVAPGDEIVIAWSHRLRLEGLA